MLVFTWLCIQYPWIPHISPFIVKQPPIIFFLLSVPVFYDYHVSGAFWIDFRLFEILEQKFRQQSVDTVVFRRARKKLNGKREKYNIGLKRGVFIAILRCLFQRDICASFNRFCCKVASWWSRLGFRYFELVRGNWQGF